MTMQMSTVSFLVGAPALPTLLVASSDKASVGHRLLKAPSAYDLHRKQFDVRLHNFRAVLVRALVTGRGGGGGVCGVRLTESLCPPAPQSPNPDFKHRDIIAERLAHVQGESGIRVTTQAILQAFKVRGTGCGRGSWHRHRRRARLLTLPLPHAPHTEARRHHEGRGRVRPGARRL